MGTKEVWKDVKDYEGMYQISNFGEVKSFKRKEERIMIKNFSKRQYLNVKLTQKGDPKTFKVHRLVANAFIPNPENKPQVNHIDGIKTNNRVENLEWCTNKENMHHAIVNGLKKSIRGEGNPNAKLSIEKVKQIKQLLDLGFLQDEVAEVYGVGSRCISKIKTGIRWGYV